MAAARAAAAAAGGSDVMFAVTLYIWNIIACLLGWPSLLLPRRWSLWAAWVWAQGHLAVARWTLGLRYEVSGRDRLPDGPYVIAARHQSAWETIAFNVIFPRPAYVLKRELFRIPVIGWWLWRVGMIGIDRSAGASALRKTVAGAQAGAADGQPVVIFPGGTRSAPGPIGRLQPGVAALYRDLGLPVVPVALNSGAFWRRNGLAFRGGTIRVAIQPPIEAGLDRKAFMARLSEALDSPEAPQDGGG